MNCPICKKEVGIKDAEAPFCSERCRLIDLGNWASDKYVVPTDEKDEELSPQRRRDAEEENGG